MCCCRLPSHARTHAQRARPHPCQVYRTLAYELARKEDRPTTAARQPILNIPNLLTFLRLVLVPFVMALWYSSHQLSPLLAAALFVTASITDWLDGYLARKVCVRVPAAVRCCRAMLPVRLALEFHAPGVCQMLSCATLLQLTRVATLPRAAAAGDCHHVWRVPRPRGRQGHVS